MTNVGNVTNGWQEIGADQILRVERDLVSTLDAIDAALLDRAPGRARTPSGGSPGT